MDIQNASIWMLMALSTIACVSANIISDIKCNKLGCVHMKIRHKLVRQKVDKPQSKQCENVNLVTRDEWGARPAQESSPLTTPVDVVYVHHTTFGFCLTPDDCVWEAKRNQDFHMDVRRFDDIGYNFLIGEDGRVYEGRGWDRATEESLQFHDRSVSIGLMGNFDLRPMKDVAYDALNGLLECGLTSNKISKGFSIRTKRDKKREFDKPGAYVLEKLQQWPDYSNRFKFT